MDLVGASKIAAVHWSQVEEGEEEAMVERKRTERIIITKLIIPCLSQLESALEGDRFDSYGRSNWGCIISQEYYKTVCI